MKPKFLRDNFDDQRSHYVAIHSPRFHGETLRTLRKRVHHLLQFKPELGAEASDFFVESPSFQAVWYLKIFQNGKYCTFPIPSVPEPPLRGYFPIRPLIPNLELSLAIHGRVAQRLPEQLMGQVLRRKFPLSRMISPQLYW